jgi:uncharacterized protein (TIGR02466 family)|tara:strand:- start:10 stop:612 length:603 start_codon:yes stop_codon:yes gene_type:complete
MELKADLWFPSIVFAGINDEINRTALKNIALAWRNKEPELAGNSNEGGWHSRSIENVDLLPPDIRDPLTQMVVELDKAIEYCRTSAGFPPLEMQNFWINVNGPGAYHTLHNHQDAMLSGVFYIDVPTDNMGDLQFYRGDEAQYYIPDNLSTYNTITSTMATYPPKPGMVVIFPSWVKHAVKQNRSDAERIAISFNYGAKR